MRKAFTFGLLIILSLLPSCLSDNEEPSFEETSLIQVGDRLPEFAVTTLDGSRLTTDSLLARAAGCEAKEATIVLFNTTCEDCRRELEKIEQTYTSATLCISREQDEAEVRSYWNEHHLSIPCAAVPDRSIYDLFATMYIPRIYVTDIYGKITAVK